MNAEAPARRSGPRLWLLAALGVAVVALVAQIMWPQASAPNGSPVSRETRTARATGGAAAVDPAELEVRLEALDAERPAPGEAQRNPFRFQPKPPPPAAAPRLFEPTEPVAAPPPAPVPQGPPPPPPIPVRFTGIIEHQGMKIAALTDCRAATWAKREGETIDGRYRLVTIGIESVVIENLDGTGRQTIKMTGECPPR